MLFYGRAQKIAVFAVDTATGIGKTGDVGNFTLKVSKDGAANAAASNTPTEIGYGLYSLELTASECSADLVCVSGVSSTSGVSISPIIATTEAQAIPYATAGAASGLALTSSVSAVETKIDTLDTVADGIATTLGTSGAGLTDVGGFSTGAKAEINAEADAALADYDAPTKAEMDDAFTAVKGATFDTSTDSLEAIRNRGDSSWLTATGFSTHSAADVWAVGTRTLSAFGFSVDVTTIESGDATTALETAATASLNSYDGPTKSEMDDAFTAVKGSTFDTSTDSLEAIRNRGDSSWLTATGFSTHSAADVWAVGTRTLSAFSFSVDVTTIESGDATTALETAATASLNSYDPPTKSEMDDAFTAVKGSTFDTSTDSLEAIRNRGDSSWLTASGFSTFDPSSDTVANVTTVGSVSALAEAAVVDVWSTYALTESYAAEGAAATPAELLYLAQAMDGEKAISSTTVTLKKLDQSTTAATYTLDSSTSPTSITRAT